MGNKAEGSVSESKEGDINLGGIFSSVKPEENTFEACWPKLSYKERAIGWISCSVVGWVLSLIASLMLAFSSDMVLFAVLYSIGQVINILGSCFLSTPKGQWKSMKKKKRRIASAVYILSIIATLVVALATPIKGLVFLFLGIQIVAYYWYTITFIPFG